MSKRGQPQSVGQMPPNGVTRDAARSSCARSPSRRPSMATLNRGEDLASDRADLRTGSTGNARLEHHKAPATLGLRVATSSNTTVGPDRIGVIAYHEQRYAQRSRTLTFRDLLPAAPRGSEIDRDVRSFIGGRSSRALPEHRRIDSRRFEVKCVNRG